MYKEIENILVRTLSPYEYEKLEELKQTYSENQIINAYKTSNVKNINYISKILMKQKTAPSWLHEEIKNEEIDNKTKKDFDDFNSFIKEFRNE